MSEFDVVDRPKPYQQRGEEVAEIIDAVIATAATGRAIRVPLENGQTATTFAQRIREAVRRQNYMLRYRKDGKSHVYLWSEKHP